MGSGGLRRLQISRSGASRVRGGFDSHAFPPLLALLFGAALTLVTVAAPVRAEDAPRASGVRDTTVRAPETARVTPVRDTTVRAEPDTAGHAAALARRSANALGEQPRMVMLRSLIIPGWGQFHNHAWFKAVGVAGAEGWLLSSILHDRSQLSRDLAAVNAAADIGDVDAHTAAVNRYNSRLDGYVGGQWLLGGLLAYALVDAYVDAHFRRFEIEFRSDPALPRDAAPDDGRGSVPTGGAGGRLSLRWIF